MSTILSPTAVRRDVRALAVIAEDRLGLLALHVSSAVIALDPGQSPKDVQGRSYITNNIRGPRADSACPGLTITTASTGKPYLGYHGRLAVPVSRCV